MIRVHVAAEKSINTVVAKTPKMRRKISMGRTFTKAALVFAVFCACIAGMFLLQSPATASTEINIRRLVQEAPDFSLYGNAQGIVWLKEYHYTLLADGSMQTDVTWAILVKETIDESWQNWSLIVPEGGNISIEKAEVYDPASAMLLTKADITTTESEGRTFYRVKFPARDEVLWVLSYRITSPRKLGVDGYVKTGISLPQWEQKITVDVPSGSSFTWLSSENEAPSLEKKMGRDRYEWHIVNRPVWRDTSLLSSFEPFIAFSLQQGKIPFYKLLQSTEDVVVPEAPDSVISMGRGANRVKAGEDIIQFVKNHPSFQDKAAHNVVRSKIPSDGPWSEWEKALILCKWLPLAGWQVNLKWITPTEITEETPITRGLLLKPVVEANIPGGGRVYFDVEQGLSLGETPPSLWGNRVYGLVNKEIVSDVIQGGGAADHRLSLRWDLDLEESGFLVGKLSFFVRNGWTGLFFSGKTPTLEEAASVLSSCTGLQLDSSKGEIKQLKYGFEIRFPVRMLGAITGSEGHQMLVKLPVFVPACLRELSSVRPPYSLRFPFAVEAEYELSLPSSMNVLTLPSTSDRDMGKVKYYEDMTYRKKKHVIRGSARVVVSSDRIDGALASALNESLRRFADFNAKTLALRAK